MPLLRIFRYKDLHDAEKRALFARGYAQDLSAIQLVEEIIDAVETKGLAAVLEYTRRFDGVDLREITVTPDEFARAESSLPAALKDAFGRAADNIRAFHEFQKETLVHRETTIAGTRIGYRYLPVEGAAVYAPGGKAAYPSSVLMGLIPAKIAGAEAILITPPDKAGSVNAAVLYAAKIAGGARVIKVGGAQGIAAAAFGIAGPRAQVILGPGNRFVTAARSILAARGLIRPDAPAGPSEVIVIADASASAKFVASDLLSQAEHGEDSPCILLTDSLPFAQQVAAEVDARIAARPERGDMKSASIRQHSFAVVFDDMNDAFQFSNEYAPEHLEICTKDPDKDFEKVRHAGSVFLGNYAPVALGDYYSGTNHILPTAGGSKLYAGVGVDSFMKRITFQQPTKESLRDAAEPIALMSRAEGLEHEHGHSVQVRFEENA